MTKLILTLILFALSFLQGSYVFGGMAPNPFAYEFCPERYCPPTPVSSPRPPKQPTPNATPETPPEPTPEPTPEPEWICPATGDATKQEYKSLCMDACKEFGLSGCGKICGDCYDG